MKMISLSPRMRQFAPLLLILLGAAIAVAAYLQTLGYPLLSDDENYITDNHKLAALRFAELWRLFIEPHNPVFEFLPLRDFSYWLDMALFGITPAAFRLHNIFLYLLSLPLAYGVTAGLWRYFRPADAASAPWAAAAVTALFALHPALVESVVWISGRKYILPNLFSLLALWFAVHARRAHGLAAPHAAAALAAFAAVMLSKSSYVAVAPVIALLWLLFWLDTPAPDRRRSQLLWPLALLLLAGLLVLTFVAKNKGFDRIPFYTGIEAATRTFAVLGWLARLVVTPEGRHFFYPVFEDDYLPAMVVLGVVVLVVTVTSAVMLLRRRSLEVFALAAFLLFCLPYMQLIPHAPPSLVSDRYVALAVWPAILLLVALCWRLKPVPRTALLLGFALLWCFQTVERPRDWRSLEALVDTDLRAYPGHYLPAFQKVVWVQAKHGLFREASETANNIIAPDFRNIISRLVDADYAVNVDAVSSRRPYEAMALLHNFELALQQPPAQSRWNPPMIYVWSHCKKILADQWDYLSRQFPDDVSVRYNAGLWMSGDQRYLNAISHLRAATESQRLPESVRGAAFYNLGFVLMSSGYAARAETPLRAALEQQPPDLRAYCLLAEVYKQAKRFEEAARTKAECPKQASGAGSAQ